MSLHARQALDAYRELGEMSDSLNNIERRNKVLRDTVKSKYDDLEEVHNKMEENLLVTMAQATATSHATLQTELGEWENRFKASEQEFGTASRQMGGFEEHWQQERNELDKLKRKTEVTLSLLGSCHRDILKELHKIGIRDLTLTEDHANFIKRSKEPVTTPKSIVSKGSSSTLRQQVAVAPKPVTSSKTSHQLQQPKPQQAAGKTPTPQAKAKPAPAPAPAQAPAPAPAPATTAAAAADEREIEVLDVPEPESSHNVSFSSGKSVSGSGSAKKKKKTVRPVPVFDSDDEDDDMTASASSSKTGTEKDKDKDKDGSSKDKSKPIVPKRLPLIPRYTKHNAPPYAIHNTTKKTVPRKDVNDVKTPTHNPRTEMFYCNLCPDFINKPARIVEAHCDNHHRASTSHDKSVKERWACECGSTFGVQARRDACLKSHHVYKDALYECLSTSCKGPHVFNSSANYGSHMYSEHSVMGFLAHRCFYCDLTFWTTQSLNRHFNHTCSGKIRCLPCGLNFTSRREKLKHYDTTHPDWAIGMQKDAAKTTCPSCHKVFVSQNMMQKHHINQHQTQSHFS